MKKIFFAPIFFLFLVSDISAAPSFSLKNFDSCNEARETFRAVLAEYQDRYTYPMPMYDVAMSPAVGTAPTAAKWAANTESFSQTNTQVRGVDEADIVKTDGKTIFSLRQSANSIEIVDAQSLSYAASIEMPAGVTPSELYLQGGRLVVIATKYANGNNLLPMRWYNPDIKTVVRVYDVASPSKPKLLRSHEIDGSLRSSRLVGEKLYFLVQSDFRIAPYYVRSGANTADIAATFDKNFSLKNIVPEIRDTLPHPKNPGKYLTSTRTSVARCQDLSTLLPDRATMKTVEMSPVFTTIASLDIRSTSAKIQSSLVFGDVGEIHMSPKSLYMVSHISPRMTSPCGTTAKCSAQSNYPTPSTLVHKFAINSGKVNYKATTTVSGTPLNQYAMDEDANGNFRIVTSVFDWSNGNNNNSTTVSVIDTHGKTVGNLSGIAKWENFQSARFIGNRLYLVTFEQIDPLFVIDLSTMTPKILGELKIPGYSTYLHPYDQNRLIGIGYDTFLNQHGGVQNGGLKIDLYNVADVKNPKQEASLRLGDAGSYSDVLSNPRAFVYYKEKNLLLLPATLMTSAKDSADPYRNVSVFQGLVGVSITPSSITEKFRTSHIAPSDTMRTEWKKQCEAYTQGNIGYEQYIPSYCKSGATIDEYLASNIWNFSSQFISRALYVGEKFYTIAEGGIRSWSFASPTTPEKRIEFKLPQNQYIGKPMPVDMMPMVR